MTIYEVINKIKSGVFFSVKYQSELPVTASAKKAGIKVIKEVESIARTGIEYNNIQKVIERKSSPDYQPSERNYTINYEWINPNRIKHNNSTNKDYVRLCPIGVAKSSYKILYNNDVITVNVDFLKNGGYIIPSYWNKSVSEIRDVCIDNIISINKNEFKKEGFNY